MSKPHEKLKTRHNNAMKQTTLIFVMIFTLTALIFSCLFPYPIFSNYNNITQSNAYDINNYQETELQNRSVQKAKILCLDWSQTDNLIPQECEFEVVDLQSGQSFMAVRTGGENHADIEPKDETDVQILKQITPWTWTRRPVLVKVNDFAYLPASLALYPHGFCQTQKSINGHLCLHFKNSKTHGTNRPDEEHQKCVERATELGENYLQSL